MKNLQKHSKFKDSGIEWIGEIPEHWEVRRCKFIFKNKKELNTKLQVKQILSLTLKGVIDNDIENPNGLVPKSYTTYQIFHKNDLVFKLIDLENISTSRVGIVTKTGAMSSAYLRLIPTNLTNPKFMYYFYFSLYQKDFFNKLGAGVRSTLNIDDLLNLECILPPLDEQKAIANYIDKKTTQIDKAINQKEKLIKLLKEQKQITINNAVTKGLNKNIKLADSGIEWIGEIPEHWEVKKLRYVFQKIGSGATPTSSETKYYDGDINWLQTGDLSDSIISKTSKTITQKALKDFSTLKIYPKNSLVIAMYGATIGKAGILDIEATTNQACCVLSDPIKVLVKFVFYYFLSSKNNIISMSYGGGQPNISQDLIKSLKIQVPPINEQEQIVNYIDKKTTQIDKAINLQTNYIEKLKEYKTSLINSVVTGKVRVI